MPIQISVYEDKLVLWNLGDLPEHWTLEKLLGKHPSQPFNPLIANAFFRAGYIESWGRGIEKINRECREHGIDPPTYDFGMAGLMLTFRANPAHLRASASGTVQDRLGEKLGETRTAIVAVYERQSQSHCIGTGKAITLEHDGHRKEHSSSENEGICEACWSSQGWSLGDRAVNAVG